MFRFKKYIVILFLSQIVFGISLGNVTDSLKSELLNVTNDSIRINIFQNVSYEYWYENKDSALKYASLALSLSERLGKNKEKASSLNYYGAIYYIWGEYEKAIKKYSSSLEIYRKLNDIKGIASALNNRAMVLNKLGRFIAAIEDYRYVIKLYLDMEKPDSNGLSNSYNNIGMVFEAQGDYKNAIEYYLLSLNIDEKLNNLDGIAKSYNNLGLVYYYNGDFDKAKKFMFDSYNIKKKADRKFELSGALNNLGMLFFESNQLDSALIYFRNALSYDQVLNNIPGIAGSLNNIGMVYDQKGNYDSALYYYSISYEKKIIIDDPVLISGSLVNIGNALLKKGKYNDAIKKASEGVKIAEEIGSLSIQKSGYSLLSAIYEKTKDYKKAFEYQKKFKELSDTLFNENKSRDIGKLEAKYEIEKSIEKKKQEEINKIKIENIQKNRRNLLQYSGIVLFLGFLFLIIFFSGRFKIQVRLLEGIIFVSFILLFEFILVLLDPFITKYTEGIPIYVLLLNALLAVLIFTAHSFFEENLKMKINKNKSESNDGNN